MKQCSKCKQNKEENEFYNKLGKKTAQCKQCINETKKLPENKQKVREYQRKCYKENTEFYKKKNKRLRHTNFAKYLIKNIKSRCKTNNIEFNLIETDIIIPKICPVLGIELKPGTYGEDTSPSVDRIDPNKGYVKDNIIIVSNRANKLKKDATLDELYLMVSRYEELLGGKKENVGI